MNVFSLSDDQLERWESYIRASPDATLAHELGWRNVVEKTYHHTPYYLMATEGNAVEGLLPLFLIRSKIFGRFLATAPYLSHGGLLSKDRPTANVLVDSARDLARAQKAKYVEFRGLQQVGHALALKDKYCTVVLSLTSDAQSIWSQFEGRARKSVRRALRSNLSVVKGHHLVEIFAEVLSRHMRELGTPFHHALFYRNILAEFPDRSEILMVHHDGQYLGGLLLVASNGTAFPLYGGVLTQYRSFSPMSLLIWETIRYSYKRGFARIDFGRSRWKSGTFLFKRQWAAQPVSLFYEYHLAEGTEMVDMDPNNPKFRLPIALWRQLPLAITRALGHYIIRDIV